MSGFDLGRIPISAPGGVLKVAAKGLTGPGEHFPHIDAIQAEFGHHDMTGIRAHLGVDAAAANRELGTNAFTAGDHVSFARSPSLHTAAHEATHVVQQRAGRYPESEVGTAGDPYEQQADHVAERVVRGESAADLLGRMTGQVPTQEGISNDPDLSAGAGAARGRGGTWSAPIQPDISVSSIKVIQCEKGSMAPTPTDRAHGKPPADWRLKGAYILGGLHATSTTGPVGYEGEFVGLWGYDRDEGPYLATLTAGGYVVETGLISIAAMSGSETLATMDSHEVEEIRLLEGSIGVSIGKLAKVGLRKLLTKLGLDFDLGPTVSVGGGIWLTDEGVGGYVFESTEVGGEIEMGRVGGKKVGFDFGLGGKVGADLGLGIEVDSPELHELVTKLFDSVVTVEFEIAPAGVPQTTPDSGAVDDIGSNSAAPEGGSGVP